MILDQFSGMLETMAQASQICEGDKYPTIGAALTALSMCISSMDKLVFLASLSWLVNSWLFLRLVQQLNVCLVSQV